MQQSTTELYGVQQKEIWQELAQMAGGLDKLAEAAKKRVAAGKPLEAIHFTDIAIGVNPKHRAAREAQIAALEMLIDQSGGTSFDEMGWLDNEIKIAKAAIS